MQMKWNTGKTNKIKATTPGLFKTWFKMVVYNEDDIFWYSYALIYIFLQIHAHKHIHSHTYIDTHDGWIHFHP